MARLAIAKGFLAEYAKLEKGVQSAVEAAIAKFAEHPHAGLHLEKLQHGRDDRIRTIRVDQFWRGVVLAPDSGDTYCLITVLPQDKAIAYATSRRFSVNQALGVLEVRDEETIQQLQPSLRTPSNQRYLTCAPSAQPTQASVSAAPGTTTTRYVAAPFTVTMTTGVTELPSQFDEVTVGQNIPEYGSVITVKNTSNVSRAGSARKLSTLRATASKDRCWIPRRPIRPPGAAAARATISAGTV